MVLKLVKGLAVLLVFILLGCGQEGEEDIPAPIEGSAGARVFERNNKDWNAVLADLDYLMQKQDWEQTRTLLADAGKNFPDKSGEISYYQAVTLFTEGKLDKAQKALEEAEAVMPGESLYYQGHVARKKGDAKKALALYQRAYEFLRTPELLSSMADLLYESKENEKAIGYYEKAIAARPDSYLDRYVLANIYFQQGNLSKSEALLKESLEINRAFRKAYIGLYALAEKRKDVRASLYYQSRALLLSKSYEKLVEILEKKEERVMRDLELVKFYLVGLFKSGVDLKAKDVLKRALIGFPGDTDLKVYQGITLELDGKKDEALEYFKKLTGDNPDNFNALVAYGDLLFNQGKDEDARVLFEKAMLLEPSNTGYRYKLAEIYRKHNDLDKELYHRGILFLYQEQLLEAVEALTRVKNPLYPHLYHFYLGKVYVERNRLDLAREQYVKAIAEKKDLVMAYLELAYVYVRLGQNNQALQLLSSYPGNNGEIKSLRQFIQKL